MTSGKPKGTLILIGGAEDKKGDRHILREFVSRCGGAGARIVVMTVATDHPAEAGQRYVDVFTDLGAGEAVTVDVSQRDDVHAEASLELIRRATGVFFTGGDQLHITSLLGGTEMDRILHERYQDGVVLAGTSAGAAMMSNSMIIGGSSETAPQMEGVRMAPGMEFILGAAVDTHFSQRGRHGRLLTAVAHYPHDLGIGLDEDTAIIVEGQTFEVIGGGSVTIFDLGVVSYTNLPDLSQYDLLSLFDIKVHVLPSGYRFDMAERRPMMPPTEKQHKRAVRVAAKRSIGARQGPRRSAGAGTNDPAYGSSTSTRISTTKRGPGLKLSSAEEASSKETGRRTSASAPKKGDGPKRSSGSSPAAGLTVGKGGSNGPKGSNGKSGAAATGSGKKGSATKPAANGNGAAKKSGTKQSSAKKSVGGQNGTKRSGAKKSGSQSGAKKSGSQSSAKGGGRK